MRFVKTGGCISEICKDRRWNKMDQSASCPMTAFGISGIEPSSVLQCLLDSWVSLIAFHVCRPWAITIQRSCDWDNRVRWITSLSGKELNLVRQFLGSSSYFKSCQVIYTRNGTSQAYCQGYYFRNHVILSYESIIFLLLNLVFSSDFLGLEKVSVLLCPGLQEMCENL